MDPPESGWSAPEGFRTQQEVLQGCGGPPDRLFARLLYSASAVNKWKDWNSQAGVNISDIPAAPQPHALWSRNLLSSSSSYLLTGLGSTQQVS